MLSGAAERDLSIELFGHTYASPVFMAPIGVLGVMTDDEHGDLATAAAAAASGVPMVASTLMQDPMEDVAAALGDTPGFFQLYTPNDRELAESFVRRAEAAGFQGIVVTLDTWTLGYRPRDLQHGTFPQLRGYCLANYFSDPVFRSKLAVPPEEDPGAAAIQWAFTFGNPGLTWDDLAWLRGLTDLPLLLKGICHPDDVRRAKDAGVDGIYCSNHGGRQAASAPATRPAARRWSTPPRGCRCSSTPGSAPAPTWSRRSPWARPPSASAAPTATAPCSAAPPGSSSCSPACSPRPT